MRARYDTKLLPEGLRATGYSVDGAMITVDAEMIGARAACPSCGSRSSHRHGRYVRCLADFPAHGRRVRVRLSGYCQRSFALSVTRRRLPGFDPRIAGSF